METAALIGISPLEFWELTPYEFSLMVKAHNTKLEDEVKAKKEEAEERLRLAYIQAKWTASFVWSKRIPSFEQMTNIKAEKKKMTPQEILDQVKKINSELGGTVY